MIRLGLRLTLAGGREAVTRLVIIAAAVALGVGLLLTTLAGDQRGQRAERPVRLAVDRRRPGARRGTRRPADPLWWQLTRRLLPRPADRPGRRGRHRAALAGAARHPAAARPGPVLRLARRWPALLRTHPGRRARRPLPRPAGRHDRRRRAARRPTRCIVIVGRTAARAGSRCRAPRGHQRSARPPPSELQRPGCYVADRHRRQRHRPDPARWSPRPCCSRC